MKNLTQRLIIPATLICGGLMSSAGALAASCSADLNSWGNGYQLNITVNSDEAQLDHWQAILEFKKKPTITNNWNADIEVEGSTVTASSLDWNNIIPAGESTSFSIQGVTEESITAPSCTLVAVTSEPTPEQPETTPTDKPSTPSDSNTAGSCPVKLYGWGAQTTGGGNASVQTVTSLSQLRSLAKDNTPRVLKLSGTFTTGSTPIEIGSNKTLIGADKNATIQGGINIKNKNNIIVRNLNILGNKYGNKPVDTIAVRGSTNLWFDHLNLTDASDGLLDLTRGTDKVTVSWNKFSYTQKHQHRLAFLVGGGSTHGNTDTGKNNVTVHHNWFGQWVDQRMPRLLFGKGHIYNNYYAATGNSYAIGTGSWASAFVENNYFNGVNNSHRFQDSNPSYITAQGNTYHNTTGKKDTGLGGKGSNPPSSWKPSYSYSVDQAGNVPNLVTSCAGPQ